MHWRQTLRIRTQDPTFLWRMVIVILISGVVLGFAVQFIPVFSVGSAEDRLAIAAMRGDYPKALALLEAMLAEPATEMEEILNVLRLLQVSEDQNSILERLSAGGDSTPMPPLSRLDPQLVSRLLRESVFDAAFDGIASEFWESLQTGEPTDGLVLLAAQSPLNRYANLALGAFWEQAGLLSKAAACYEREGELPEADDAREQAVQIYLAEEDLAALHRLANEHLYADNISALVRIQLAIAQRDWKTVWWELPRNEWQRYETGPVLLALFAGICWFAIAAQAGQVTQARGARWWLCVAAIPLGMLSIWPTLFLGIWEEEVWNVANGDDLYSGVRYFVLSVGLREEFCKLLLLLPLVPFLARRGNELETLVVAACIGLGFAIEENAGYFAASSGSSTIGRFLTANFFHMSATGLIGLALLRAIWYPREKGLELLAVFGVIVFAHGFYDAAIVVPALRQFNIVSSIIYILLAYQFFHELRSMRTKQPETISLTANFLGGVSLLTSVTLVYLSARYGLETASRLLVPELLSVALMAYMFLREMPNSLLRHP